MSYTLTKEDELVIEKARKLLSNDMRDEAQLIFAQRDLIRRKQCGRIPGVTYPGDDRIERHIPFDESISPLIGCDIESFNRIPQMTWNSVRFANETFIISSDFKEAVHKECPNLDLEVEGKKCANYVRSLIKQGRLNGKAINIFRKFCENAVLNGRQYTQNKSETPEEIIARIAPFAPPPDLKAAMDKHSNKRHFASTDVSAEDQASYDTKADEAKAQCEVLEAIFLQKRAEENIERHRNNDAYARGIVMMPDC